MLDNENKAWPRSLLTDTLMNTQAVRDLLKLRPEARSYLETMFEVNERPQRIIERYRQTYVDAWEELDETE